MKYGSAIAVCGALFMLYGLFCLAMGWKNLGGFIPMLLVLGGLSWVWRTMTREKPPVD